MKYLPFLGFLCLGACSHSPPDLICGKATVTQTGITGVVPEKLPAGYYPVSSSSCASGYGWKKPQ